jgi:hypothetical protein
VAAGRPRLCHERRRPHRRQWDLATPRAKKIEGLKAAIAYAEMRVHRHRQQARLGDQSLAGSKGAVFAIAADPLGQLSPPAERWLRPRLERRRPQARARIRP